MNVLGDFSIRVDERIQLLGQKSEADASMELA
jgi:hypothetical protein